MRYKGTDKTLSEIAQELNVEAVVDGSVLREGDQVRVTAQLIEAGTERNLWADRYERNLTSILALQGEVAQAIAREIQVTLTPDEENLLTSSRRVNPEAYEDYLKGQSHFYKLTPADLDTALQYFELALEKDPDYALAHVGTALYWAGLQQGGLVPSRERGPKARAAAQRAVELDDSLAEAHYALAIVRGWTDWDWAGAEIAFRRAIELNPSFADVRAYYSHYLMIMRRPDEALDQIERALELDPFNPLFQALYGVVLESGFHQYDEAIEQFRGVLRTVPNHPIALAQLVATFRAKGMYEEAFDAGKTYHATLTGDPGAVEVLERGYAEGGFAGAMHRLAEWYAAYSLSGPVSRLEVAATYASAGEKDPALEWLERGFEERDPNLPNVGVMLSFDGFHNDPRFQDLLRRMNFPEDVLARYLNE
jgi:tetratricopeptide (TPR) repeat protein